MMRWMKALVGPGLAGCVLVALALLALAGTSEAATIAFDFTQTGNQDWTGRLGNYFDVDSPIEITALGVFDDPPPGLVNGIDVGIFDVTADTLLFSITIGPGSPGTLINNTRFVDIAPFALDVGSYAVVAVGFGTDDPNYNTNIPPGTPVTVNTGGGLISIPNPSGLYDSNTDLGTDLTGVSPGDWTFGGGSFQFQAATPVPEPSTVALLLGPGLLGVGLIRRRMR